MKVPFSFLTEQFQDPEPIFEAMRRFLKRCDFTLGEDLLEFEKRYAKYTGSRHAIGVGTGTDALFLSLKVAGVGPGDEVITPPNSFIATTGAIVQCGARPVYVDIGPDQTIDPSRIEGAITPRTKAILPVHWAGAPADMKAILQVAARHKIPVVEDACQALGARIDGQHVGTFGLLGGFSCHPLKPLHVWGDGGVIVTNSDELAAKLRLLRNHGMSDRDTIAIYGVNSRFDNLHAIVGNYVFETLDATIEKRIAHAARYDAALSAPAFEGKITLPPRLPGRKHVYHLYKIEVENRDELLSFLQGQGIEAKVHYPIPLHLQPAAKPWGHSEGDFPVTERESRRSLTLPCHQYLDTDQIDYVIEKIGEWFRA